MQSSIEQLSITIPDGYGSSTNNRATAVSPIPEPCYKSRDFRALGFLANNIYGDIEDHRIALVVTCSYVVHIL